MGTPLTEVTRVRVSWLERLADNCEHDWPPDLNDPDAACSRCHLPYREFEVRS